MELLDTRKRRAGLRPVRLFLECQHNTIRKHKDGAPWCSTSVNFGGGERMAEQSANEILKRQPRTEMDDNTPDCRVVLIGRWALLRAYETK